VSHEDDIRRNVIAEERGESPVRGEKKVMRPNTGPKRTDKLSDYRDQRTHDGEGGIGSYEPERT
jgi:hypothetical protein